ncbi:MAG: DNA polymerase IV [Clostridia bacterium]
MQITNSFAQNEEKYCHDRIILHSDANNFFASVEGVICPEIKTTPFAVSGNPKIRTGIILAKNTLAKQCGVQTGETIWEAKQKCCNLVCVPPHYEFYEEYSKKLKEIYGRFTNLVEPFGIDECWLDVTNSKIFGSGEEIAEKIRTIVKNELNITVSVGVSFCKLFAKLASDLKKPDATSLISRDNFKNIVWNLPINSAIGIGKQMEKRMHSINVYKLGDIVNIPDDIIKKKFGVVGTRFKQSICGNDFSSVCFEIPIPKSVGNGMTTVVDIKTKAEFESVALFLSDEISTRLRQQNLVAGCVSASIKTNEFEWFSHEKRTSFFVDTAIDIKNMAIEIFNEYWKFDKKVRAIRICCSKLQRADKARQMSLFESKNLCDYATGQEKKQKLNEAIDTIRKKYGNKSIKLASINENDGIIGI